MARRLTFLHVCCLLTSQTWSCHFATSLANCLTWHWWFCIYTIVKLIDHYFFVLLQVSFFLIRLSLNAIDVTKHGASTDWAKCRKKCHQNGQTAQIHDQNALLGKKTAKLHLKQDVDQKQGRILRNATVGHHLSCQPRRKNAKNDV